jgi:hypothetical protein
VRSRGAPAAGWQGVHGGEQAQAWDRHHDPQRCAERCVGSRQLGQFAMDMSNLGVDGREHGCLQLGDQRLAGGVTGRRLSIAQAEALLDQRLVSG